MKSPTLRILIFLFWSNLAVGQEFITTIHVENALGEKDSVHIGYDTGATPEIDSIFGEVDILNIQFSDSFEVRLGNVNINVLDCDENRLMDVPELVNHQSKIDIYPRHCEGWANFISFSTLFIKDTNFPITITWDTEVFQDSCRDGAFISDWHPGGWFDAGCSNTALFPDYINFTGEATIEARSGIYLVDNFLDTLSMFHIPIAPKKLFNNVDDELAEQLIVYPNPTTGEVHIDNTDITRIKVFNASGRFIRYGKNSVNLGDHPDGIYYLQLWHKEGGMVTKKVVKSGG